MFLDITLKHIHLSLGELSGDLILSHLVARFFERAFPAIYLLHVFLADKVIALLMCIVMEIMGLLFILKLKFIKPGKKGYIFLMLLAIALFVLYVIFGR